MSFLLLSNDYWGHFFYKSKYIVIEDSSWGNYSRTNDLLFNVRTTNVKMLITHFRPMFHLCTNQLVFTSKMFGKHLSKSDILSKVAGPWPASLLEISLFHRFFSNILLLKTNYIRNWNIARKWVKKASLQCFILKEVIL